MKPLACWLGKHSWTMRVEHGEEFFVCSACDKEPRREGWHGASRAAGPGLGDGGAGGVGTSIAHDVSAGSGQSGGDAGAGGAAGAGG
jgi:hypothetical protein